MCSLMLSFEMLAQLSALLTNKSFFPLFSYNEFFFLCIWILKQHPHSCFYMTLDLSHQTTSSTSILPLFFPYRLHPGLLNTCSQSTSHPPTQTHTFFRIAYSSSTDFNINTGRKITSCSAWSKMHGTFFTY